MSATFKARAAMDCAECPEVIEPGEEAGFSDGLPVCFDCWLTAGDDLDVWEDDLDGCY